MWDKLAAVEERYEEIGRKLTEPETIRDRAQFSKMAKEHKDLTEIVATFRAYKKAQEELKGSEDVLKLGGDPDMITMAKEEIGLLRAELEGIEQRLTLQLVPKDPNDSKNVIVEIRAGAGGDEAGLFAAELFRMFVKYAETNRFKVEILSSSDNGSGGLKELIGMIQGEGAFSKFKFERGVHRVQRVPATENAGRIHTSTVTVAVLPEAEEFELKIEEKDIRIDVYRSGGSGGQSVNTTDSAVRITHLPTGLMVAIQDEKSQHKNRDKAMRILRSRLMEMEQAKLDEARRADRLSQVGSGDRSEKIRTYNFPQSRVTDHRIGLSLYSLTQVMEGDLNQLVEPLTSHYRAEALRGEGVSHDEKEIN